MGSGCLVKPILDGFATVINDTITYIVHTFINLHFSSAHPQHTHAALVKGELIRPNKTVQHIKYLQ